ncbi:sugar porter family MFS transporter [Aureobasidium subglaciale]|nr:sugar porter family MFS transporter [Aureobasidium subglaciale]KAI5219867.1 sugar porter family MFS transporter [Aureobasidium subglaciale]KAI5223679.1 sugar porter family MFS transporter [Aureobasidium subglaciale]KAI5260578.1 sugar porter family MFS transporter [Aureobasidium subglaciale]
MADTRTFSIAGDEDTKRNGSITAGDMHHLARVDTAIAGEAARATQSEISMTLLQGIKTYPKAIGWSILLSTCIIMEGFDIVLINSLMALPAFQLRFGEPSADGSYQISAAWQSGLSNGALVGEVIGLLFIGYIVERIGYKKTMVGSLVGLTGFIFIVFFAQSLPMLLVGEILMGIPWGAFQTLTTTYAAEVCPVSLRAYLTTYVNLCWVIGQFLSSAVLKAVADKTGPIGYKLPYGLQWIWPLPLIIGIALAPESPWWLVRQGRREEAKAQVLRLTSRNQTDSGFNADETVNMMVYTDELEKASTSGTSYLDCFKGTDRRRTEIVCMVWAVQTLCGASSFTGYSTYFFEQAGLDVSSAFSMTLGQYGLGAVGTVLSWLLMMKFGRRTLYLWGQIAMASILMIVGLLGIAPASAAGAHWGIGAMILIYTFIYDMTVGPVCYSLVAEIPSTRLRNKTVVLARNLYNITGVVANILTPHMLNPDAWNWGAKAGFFWAGTGALCAVWTYFRVPEPKGRSYAEMDMLFDTHVSARNFKQTKVESFGSMAKAEKLGDADEKNSSQHVEEVGCQSN